MNAVPVLHTLYSGPSDEGLELSEFFPIIILIKNLLM